MAVLAFDGNDVHKFGNSDDDAAATTVTSFVKEFSVELSFATAQSPRLGTVIAPQNIGSASGNGTLTFYASNSAGELTALLNTWTWDAVDTNTTKPPSKYWFVEEPDGTAGSVRHVFEILPQRIQGQVNRAGQGGDQERTFAFVLRSYTKETIV